MLIESDRQRRQLYISLGCFLANAAMAGQSIGIGVDIAYTKTHPHAASITLAEAPAVSRDWRPSLEARQNYRGPLAAQPLPDALLRDIASLRQDSASVAVCTNSGGITLISDCVRRATKAQLSQPAFRRELADWIRPNNTSADDGMPGAIQGMNDLQARLGPIIVRRFDISNQQAKQDAAALAQAPAVAVICSADDIHGWLDSGRLAETVAVTAAATGVSTAFFAAPIEDDTEALRIQRKLQLPERPQALLRLGRPTGTRARTPRRAIAAVAPGLNVPNIAGGTAEDPIVVQGLVKRYGPKAAVAGIDLRIAAGEIFALLGPNGAGKTTTVEILEGFRVPTSGYVSVLGSSPDRADRRWQARIGVVLQTTSQFDELDCQRSPFALRRLLSEPTIGRGSARCPRADRLEGRASQQPLWRTATTLGPCPGSRRRSGTAVP